MQSITNQWTLKKGLTILLGSVACNLLLSGGCLFFYAKYKQKRLFDERYQIVAIVQTGPEREALKTAYLAELIGLSVDVPQNLYAFDLQKAKEALLSSPLIGKANLKRLLPSALYIDYEVRKPLAWMADYPNTAIDKEGYLFPVAPFFSPQQIPEIYLGLPSFGAPEDSFGRKGGKWGAVLKNRHQHLAFDLLQAFEGSPWKEGLVLKRIDVSNAFAPSLGRREIVLFTEEEICVKDKGEMLTFVFPKILRLAPKDYTQQLQNFFTLRKSMLEDYRKQLVSSAQAKGGKFAPLVIDLRISQLAFVENRS